MINQMDQSICKRKRIQRVASTGSWTCAAIFQAAFIGVPEVYFSFSFLTFGCS
jgi:hypothetical protein